MKNDLFEKAKQAVADKHQFENWEYGIFVSDREAVKALYQEAAEWMCNEAVKADRARIKKSCIYDSEGYDCFDEMVFDLLPLPFPQQPDER